MNEEVEQKLLLAYQKTLKEIFNDYPNASYDMKCKCHVVGASDLAMNTFAVLIGGDFPAKLNFARQIDNIRNEIFPPQEPADRKKS